MMDMQKEREAFEALQNQKIFEWFEFDSSVNAYVLKDISATLEKLTALAELNYGWDMWQAAKADAEREFNNFLFEYKKTLIKTYEDDEDNIHDYWRGFANCAKASEIVLNEMIEAAQEKN